MAKLARWVCLFALCVELCAGVGCPQGCDDASNCTHDYCDAVRGCVHHPRSCDSCSQPPPLDVVFVFECVLPLNNTQQNLLLPRFTRFVREVSSRRFTRFALVCAAEEPVVLHNFTSDVGAIANVFENIDALISQKDAQARLRKTQLYLVRSLLAVSAVTSHVRRSVEGYEVEPSVPFRQLEFLDDADIHVVLAHALLGQTVEVHEAPSAEEEEHIKALTLETMLNTATSAVKVSMTVILDIHDVIAVRHFGHPSNSAMHSDGRELLWAPTLKQSDSPDNRGEKVMQVQFLANRAEMRIFDVASIPHLPPHSLCPPHYPRKHFCSKCQSWSCDAVLGCQSSKVICGEGEKCVPSVGCCPASGCVAEPVPYFPASETKTRNYTLAHLVNAEVEVKAWGDVGKEAVAPQLAEAGVPVLLKGSVASTWPAVQWTVDDVRTVFANHTFNLVKKSRHGKRFFDPDSRAAMANWTSLHHHTGFDLLNLTAQEFMARITDESDSAGYHYFTALNDSLHAHFSPSAAFYLSEQDASQARRFLWLSSPGSCTHTHFDQDHNFFCQVVGYKRFTLFSHANSAALQPFPRLHPLWHKARVDFFDPDLTMFPEYEKATAMQVILGPGDVLYIPPNYWHHVETLTPSLSLSTWSADTQLYFHMNAIYGHDHKFDQALQPRARVFALRLYLDLMIHELFGKDKTTLYFSNLLNTRFRGLEQAFSRTKKDSKICHWKDGTKTPAAQHVYGEARFDVTLMSEHFMALPVDVRQTLFADYVEELTANVVGPEKVLAFFRYCFRGQTYELTTMGTEDHALWNVAVDEE